MKILYYFIFFYFACNKTKQIESFDKNLILPTEIEIEHTLILNKNKILLSQLAQNSGYANIVEFKEYLENNISAEEVEFYYKKYKPNQMEKFGQEGVLVELKQIRKRIAWRKIFNQTSINLISQINSKKVSDWKKISNLDDPELGNKNGEIKVIEFSDFGCYYCSKSQVKAEEIRLKYKERISWIYKDLPDSEEDSKIFQAHVFANCIFEVSPNQYYNLFQKLYANYKYLSKDYLEKYATEIFIKKEKIDFCLNTLGKKSKWSKEVLLDIEDAEKLKIKGTPSYIINGFIAIGEIEKEKFISIIESSINKGQKNDRSTK